MITLNLTIEQAELIVRALNSVNAAHTLQLNLEDLIYQIQAPLIERRRQKQAQLDQIKDE